MKDFKLDFLHALDYRLIYIGKIQISNVFDYLYLREKKRRARERAPRRLLM